MSVRLLLSSTTVEVTLSLSVSLLSLSFFLSSTIEVHSCFLFCTASTDSEEDPFPNSWKLSYNSNNRKQSTNNKNSLILLSFVRKKEKKKRAKFYLFFYIVLLLKEKNFDYGLLRDGFTFGRGHVVSSFTIVIIIFTSVITTCCLCDHVVSSFTI
jgi:hypothetical protein